ncbi:MAG: preprotein translocase subunit SecG [Deltaproteobacteria bacterium]|nr:preprotein translocase subunit SecG [Deltaproteobacteria bacterium]
MSILVIIIHIIVSIALIMIVLLQTGKGADMGAASSQTLFGSTGASTFLSKATTVAAIVFMLTSLTLAYVAGNKNGKSVIMETTAPIEETAPSPAAGTQEKTE